MSNVVDTSITVHQFYVNSSINTQVVVTRIGDDAKVYYSGSVLDLPNSLMDKVIHYIEAVDKHHIHVVLK